MNISYDRMYNVKNGYCIFAQVEKLNIFYDCMYNMKYRYR